MIKSSNPALNSIVFQTRISENDDIMTVSGTINKSLFLISLVFCTAVLSWDFIINSEDGKIYVGVAFTIAVILAVTTYFKINLAPFTAPPFALFEGVFLGGVSGLLNEKYTDIAIHSILLTFGTFICLLLAYKSQLFHVSDNFKLGVVAGTGAICLIYIAALVLSNFSIQVPLIHANGLVGLIISLFIVGFAALNLVLDFDFIEQGENRGAPKSMEWYASFGLLVSLIWLYVQNINLLLKVGWRKK